MAKQKKSLIEYVWNFASKASSSTVSVGETSQEISSSQIESLMGAARRYIKANFSSSKPYILSLNSAGDLQLLIRAPGTKFYASGLEEEILNPVGFCFSPAKRVQLNLGHGKLEYCDKYIVKRGSKK